MKSKKKYLPAGNLPDGSQGQGWSEEVTKHSIVLDLEEGVPPKIFLFYF